jgi:hypothetical protein
MHRWQHVTLAVLLAGSTAVAAPNRRVTVDVPAAEINHAAPAHVIVLERCRGGCTLPKSTSNNAQGMQSTIPQGAGPFTIGEFANGMGDIGAAADAEWAQVLACVQEVYSDFDITVRDTKPTDSTYHLAVVAGLPSQAGLGNDILGIAPLAGDCSPQDNVISFSFANAHPQGGRVANLCWTVAQESAHAFGLDHEFQFKDGSSTCSDPMTYRMDCGGQRFFRNKKATCGEFAARACKCGSSQNSYAQLLAIFGKGTTRVAPPTSTIVFPVSGTLSLGAVQAMAGSQRGVDRVEVLLNNNVWATSKGLPFGPAGQMNPGNYTISMPQTVPQSILDIVVRAYDDVGVFTDSPPVTVTNGAACTSAAGCAPYQKCEEGRCFWDPPTGQAGDSCEYAQFCTSNNCVETSDGKYCTEPCDLEEGAPACPNDLACVEASPDNGLCLPTSDGGCCSTGGDRQNPAPFAGLALVVAACIMRRRGRFAVVSGTGRKRDESC